MDCCIRKIDKSTGAILNESFIDFYGGERTDVAVKVLIAEPYVYVIGTSTFTSSPFDKDIVVIKTDTSLNTIWTRNINNTGNPDDVAVDAGLDIFGNLYVLGNTTRTTTGGDILLRKYNSSGTVLFTKFYTSTGGNYSDAATALAVEPNGVCNITGYYNSGTLGTRLLALKVWSNGAQLWAKYHDVTTGAVRPDEGVSVSSDPVSGDVFVCGRGQNSLGNYDWVVVRFAGSDGTKLWNKKYIGTSSKVVILRGPVLFIHPQENCIQVETSEPLYPELKATIYNYENLIRRMVHQSGTKRIIFRMGLMDLPMMLLPQCW